MNTTRSKNWSEKSNFHLALGGHRILRDVDRLSIGINLAIKRIQVEKLTQKWYLLSTLSEGAEQLLVRQILQVQSANLIAVLPMTREVYRKNFQSENSREEFDKMLQVATEVFELPMADTRLTAFQAANDFVLEHCDMLLVIWDGKPAQGAGGTGELAMAARQRSLPLAWIHTGNRLPGTHIPTSLGEEQGTVSYEHFDQMGDK